MIKIIKDGIKPKKYKTIYTFECKNCKCEFEFEESDCKFVATVKRINGTKMATINCPCCNEDVEGDLNRCTSRQEEIVEDEIDLGDKTVIDEDANCIWSPSLCKCPNCGSHNTLRNDSFVLTSWPAQYGFKCKDCGHRWTGHEQTLINPKVYYPWDNEHCNNCPNKNLIGDMCSFCSHSPYRVTYNNEVNE